MGKVVHFQGMTARRFWLLFCAILMVGFVVRIVPVLQNNFHFTMDQGEDAVHVREILERGQILLRGPETNVTGLFAGPLWYYFLAIGYVLFGGHPAAAVVLLTILSLLLTGVLMVKIAERVSSGAALLVGASLQFYWWFYDVSRYGFNPFPLVCLSVFAVLMVIDYLGGRKKAMVWAAVPVGLAFHAELAGATVLLLFYGLVGGWLFLTKKLELKKLLLGWFIVGLFFLPNIIYEFKADTSQVQAIKTMVLSPNGVFSENRFARITVNLGRNIADAAFPQKPSVGLVIFLLVLLIYFKSGWCRENEFVTRFVLLTGVFLLVCWLFFGVGTGWRAWHSVAVPTLLFVSLLLLISIFPRPGKLIFLAVVLTPQLVFFQGLYTHFISPLEDQSLLRNELVAIDWIYQQSAGQGFYVYNYLPSVRDYSHQYLFWWHGKRKYGYVPCEYSRYPGTPDFFVPGYQYYQRPLRPCSRLRFLLMEPDPNWAIKRQWYQGVAEKTRLLNFARFGEIVVEERMIEN